MSQNSQACWPTHIS